ncbi:hypothetical protein HYH03_016770 [Edaphochlamys debaryana]|uniref:DOMON domain-containing protein n=1 Tax=Edaphochlamys debaryana TaxID=47281 RepID=A0A835XIC7_9CHLO|nr:hypothetical protein HYH03_016770 [Edaphochlamys debaryana]|eukprot:KAG2484351.1 hypothetical protein HYH03_016770 [Edaphochlamys debaryana]
MASHESQSGGPGTRLALVLVAAALAMALVPVSQAADCWASFSKSEYPNCEQLAPSYALHWQVNSDDGTATFAVELDGDTWGWIGLGISEGGMLAADIAVLQYDTATDRFTLGDYWAQTFGRPALDAQQDVRLIMAHRNHGRTIFAFRRPLHSCDTSFDQRIFKDTLQWVVYAYGEGPLSYHGVVNRGSKWMRLWQTIPPPPKPDLTSPDIQTVDVRHTNAPVPPATTTYICENFALPSDRVYHVVAFEAKITSKFVHHITTWSCKNAPKHPPGELFNCTGSAVTDMTDCTNVFLAWAPGVTTVELPPNTGIAFGKDQDVQYLSLSVHYNNPEHVEGAYDSSGIRFFFTPILREIEMGLMLFGTNSINVPPGAPLASTVPSRCPSNCTSKFPQPMTFFFNFFHMHISGRKIITQHIRNGVELPPIERTSFNFNFQGPVEPQIETRTFLPGDEFITTCSYTGVGRDVTTHYGPSSFDEMVPTVNNCWDLSPNAPFYTCMVGDELNAIFTAANPLPLVYQALQTGKLISTAAAPMQPYTPYNATVGCRALPDTWGWIGLGISEGGMLAADIAVLQYDTATDRFTLGDYWAQTFGRPALDEQQDVRLLSAARSGGRTIYSFRRPLHSCDTADREILKDTLQWVIFAYGVGPLNYHSQNRGSKVLRLWPTGPLPAKLDLTSPDVEMVDLVHDKALVPAITTSYLCKNFELPADMPYHIIAFEPVITTPHVHHITTWACRHPPTHTPGELFDCTSNALSDMPDCTDVFLAWAPGISRVEMPDHVGLPFGKDQEVKYITLSIHYNNPEHLDNAYDSSGLRFYYTAVLREIEMGLIIFGTNSINVPPGAPLTSTAPNLCPSACTSQFPQPMTIFMTFFHMHSSGRKAVTQHIRNGVELPPIERTSFNFNFQGPVDGRPETRTFLPGDEFITTCSYTGEGRDMTTHYGPGSMDEMCWIYAAYYPRVPVSNCWDLSPSVPFITCMGGDDLKAIFTSPDPTPLVLQAAQQGKLIPTQAAPLPTFTPFNATEGCRALPSAEGLKASPTKRPPPGMKRPPPKGRRPPPSRKV